VNVHLLDFLSQQENFHFKNGCYPSGTVTVADESWLPAVGRRGGRCAFDMSERVLKTVVFMGSAKTVRCASTTLYSSRFPILAWPLLALLPRWSAAAAACSYSATLLLVFSWYLRGVGMHDWETVCSNGC
jgi:hypothetical protein